MLESVVHKLINDQTGTAISMLLGLDTDLPGDRLDELRDLGARQVGG